MSHSPHYLIKSRASPHQPSSNIFINSGQPGLQNPYQLDQQNKVRSYSLAGDRTFRQKLAQEIYLRHQKQQQANINAEKLNMTENLSDAMPNSHSVDLNNQSNMESELRSRLMNTTQINHKFNSSIITKMSKHERLSLTKDARNMSRFEEQQEEWKNNNPRHNSLIERATNRIYAVPNPPQIDLVNNNPTNFWELSLRNPNKKVLKHLQGVPLEKEKFEELLQTSKGIHVIEDMVPKLDIDKIKRLRPQDMVLEAKSKIEKELNCTTKSAAAVSQERYPEYLDQVLKADWNRASLARKNANMLPKISMKIGI